MDYFSKLTISKKNLWRILKLTFSSVVLDLIKVPPTKFLCWKSHGTLDGQKKLRSVMECLNTKRFD